MTHHHSDSHQHHHTHDHKEHSHSRSATSSGSDKDMPLKEKLALLLKHWIEHNNSHKESYVSWADKAESDKSQNTDLKEAAKFIRQTAELSAQITENLEKALKSIG